MILFLNASFLFLFKSHAKDIIFYWSRSYCYGYGILQKCFSKLQLNLVLPPKHAAPLRKHFFVAPDREISEEWEPFFWPTHEVYLDKCLEPDLWRYRIECRRQQWSLSAFCVAASVTKWTVGHNSKPYPRNHLIYSPLFFLIVLLLCEEGRRTWHLPKMEVLAGKRKKCGKPTEIYKMMWWETHYFYHFHVYIKVKIRN